VICLIPKQPLPAQHSYSVRIDAKLATGEGSRYKMLSVIIQLAVRRQIAGTAEPGSLKGKVIEQTTPQVVGGKYVNMRISAATQLRVLAER
jgi:hypothetical protein